MRTIILTTILLLSFSVNAQIQWVSDFSTAKSLCKESGKLMVIDFWADWCKPCRVMEEELWDNPDNHINHQNFIGVKINVDIDKTTPGKFAVSGIPKVVITLPDGEVLWEKTGFYDAEEFVEILNSIPKDVSELYQSYFSVLKLTKDSKCAFDIASQFQQLAGKTINEELKNAFIRYDEEYFKKSLKDDTDPFLAPDIEICLLLNDVYKGKAEKALKKFNKTYGSAENCRNKELAHFFLANCYKTLDDTENFNKELELLSNHDFISQLE